MKSWCSLCVLPCLGQFDQDGTQLLQSNSHHHKGRSWNEDLERLMTVPDVVVKELLRDQSHAESLMNRATARDASQTIIANLLALPTERQSELVQFATSSAEAHELLDKLPVKTRDTLLLMVDDAMDKSVVDKGMRKKSKNNVPVTTTTTTTTKDLLTRTLGPWYMQEVQLSDGVFVEREDKRSSVQLWGLTKVSPADGNAHITEGVISAQTLKVDVNDSDYTIRDGLWYEVGGLLHENETFRSAAKKSNYAARWAHTPYWKTTAEDLKRKDNASQFVDIPELFGSGSLKTMGALLIDEVKESEIRYKTESHWEPHDTTVGRYPIPFGFVEACFDTKSPWFRGCELPLQYDFSIQFYPAEEISVTVFEQCLKTIRFSPGSSSTPGGGMATKNTNAGEASALLPGSKDLCWDGSCGDHGCMYFEMPQGPTTTTTTTRLANFHHLNDTEWANLDAHLRRYSRLDWPERDESSKYIKFQVGILMSGDDKFSFFDSVAHREAFDNGWRTIKLDD